MIKKKDIGLVIDTNILSDIVKSSDSSTTFEQRLVEWIKKIVSGMDLHPSGKTVTLFVNKQILDDYTTGLSRLQNKKIAKQIRYFFEKNIVSKKFAVPDYRISLSFRIYKGQMNSASRRRLSDKSDEKFLVLLENVSSNQSWKNWAIIFASRDRSTFNEIRDNIIHVKQVCLVDSKCRLDKAIEC